jgi:hypothetical protein
MIIDLLNARNKEGAVAFLDQEKAFKAQQSKFKVTNKIKVDTKSRV